LARPSTATLLDRSRDRRQQGVTYMTTFPVHAYMDATELAALIGSTAKDALAALSYLDTRGHQYLAHS
jgi:hypothetical protein